MRDIVVIIVTIISGFGMYKIIKEIKKEKNESLQVILAIFAAMLLFPIIILFLDLINIGNYIDISALVSKEGWLNFAGSYFAGISAAILSAYIVIIMTNRQIEIQSKETYRPRLKLEFAKIKRKSEHIYLYDLMSENMKKKNIWSDNYKIARLNIRLKNIGVGLAQDIKFYSLNNGNECVRTLYINKEKSQKTFSTEEIPINESLSFDFDFKYYINKTEEEFKEDFSLILCHYKDINGNEYKVLIGVNVKNEIEYENGFVKIIIDSYYCQENTEKYSKIVGKYKKNYTKIMSEINIENKEL